MSFLRTTITAACIAAITAIPAYSQSMKRIRKEADFVAIFVGKTLEFNGGSIVLSANGTAKGNVDGKGAIRGSWVWHKGFWCRNLTIGGNETGTDCQKVEYNGTSAVFTRDQGRGKAITITIR